MSGGFVHTLDSCSRSFQLSPESYIPVVQHFLPGSLDGKHEKSQFFCLVYCFSCRPELLLNMWESHREETIFVLLLSLEY